MSRMTKKGIAAVLFVGLLVAPVAAAAPAERSEERAAPPVTGWFAELVDWVGGWFGGRRNGLPDPSPTGKDDGYVSRVSAEDNCDGHGGLDPAGAC